MAPSKVTENVKRNSGGLGRKEMYPYFQRNILNFSAIWHIPSGCVFLGHSMHSDKLEEVSGERS